ncbi:hypothetical protein, partial [Citrobacter freundii]|uniref:hypothetical protein n=1 Tax=Citrobacter freundii TaxID=546 RepID=UPI001952E130
MSVSATAWVGDIENLMIALHSRPGTSAADHPDRGSARRRPKDEETVNRRSRFEARGGRASK